jgi:hypothetical protein
MGSSQFDNWLASEMDLSLQEVDVQPRDENQQEWLAFLDQQTEADYEASLKDPAYLAWIDRQGAIFAGEAV